MNKAHLKEKLLEIENMSVEQAKVAFDAYFASARLRFEEVQDAHEQSQQRQSAVAAHASHERVEDHLEHIAIVQNLSFAPSKTVRPGAVVKVAGRCLVVAVPTQPFEIDGEVLLGVSPNAPLVRAMNGLEAGEEFTFNGQTLTVDEVR